MPFTIVLVCPEHPHNIGFVARSMHSNALSDLRIVTSRRPLPKNCWQTAHASADILDNAKLYKTLQEAISDCSYSVAFSRRLFDTQKPHISLPELPPVCKDKQGTIALVFGRESCGLSLEDINLCALQCEIPVAGQMSINLSHAVSVASYELCRFGLLNLPLYAPRNKPPITHRKPANIDQLNQITDFVAENLPEKYQKLPWLKPSIQSWLQKLNPTQAEYSALFGIIRGLTKKNARS